MEKKHKFHISDGRLHFPSFDVFNQELRNLPDGKYTLTLKKHRKSRSLSQNAYYWIVLKAIADYCGYDDTNELHDIFKAKFLRQVGGAFGFRIQSTSKLSTQEMNEYLDKIIRTGKEAGATILTPDEYLIIMNEDMYNV